MGLEPNLPTFPIAKNKGKGKLKIGWIRDFVAWQKPDCSHVPLNVRIAMSESMPNGNTPE
jgi:hypothetical protein